MRSSIAAPLSYFANHLLEFIDVTSPPFFGEGGFVSQKARRDRVLVVGYGWGTHAFVQTLDQRQYDVHVVSTRPHRLNQPSMIASLQATYTPAAFPVTTDTLVALNKDSRQVTGSSGTPYSYDYLVIGTGSESYDFQLPGVTKHTLMCKTGEDIEAIRARTEGAASATVLGAGPTGIELACKLRFLGLPVKLIEGWSTILPGFSEAFRARTAEELLLRDIGVIKQCQIKGVDADAIHVMREGVQERIPYGPNELLIWTCGIRPSSFVRSITGGPPLTVDSHLSCGKGVYAIGDAVRGKGPPTAQNARQQGTYLALLFNRRFQHTPPYEYKELGRALDLTDGGILEVSDRVWYAPYFIRKTLWPLFFDN